MALHEVTGAAGSPWEPGLHGRLDRYVVESELLAGNPQGAPSRRPLYVYRPLEVEIAGESDVPLVYDVPAVYVLHAFTRQLDMWLARSAFEPTLVERIDAMFAAGEAPPAVVVFVDGWTPLGGSQWLNSTGTGRYQDYLADEVTAFVDQHYPTARDPTRRGVTGHSSGGYGALRAVMDRPDRFAGGAVAHAPDALFEVCCLPDFPTVARVLRERFSGSLAAFYEAFAAREKFDYGKFGVALEMLAYASAYSPAVDGSPELPFELGTARMRPEVWERWLAHDPVRLAGPHARELAGLRHLHVEAGRRDEANLDLGAQAFSDELTAHGVEHSFELFDGGHTGLAHRYPTAIAELIGALAS